MGIGIGTKNVDAGKDKNRKNIRATRGGIRSTGRRDVKSLIAEDNKKIKASKEDRVRGRKFESGNESVQTSISPDLTEFAAFANSVNDSAESHDASAELHNADLGYSEKEKIVSEENNVVETVNENKARRANRVRNNRATREAIAKKKVESSEKSEKIKKERLFASKNVEADLNKKEKATSTKKEKFVEENETEQVIDNNNAKVQIRHRRVPLESEKKQEDSESVKFTFSTTDNSTATVDTTNDFDLNVFENIANGNFGQFDDNSEDDFVFDEDGNLVRKSTLEALKNHLDENIIEYKDEKEIAFAEVAAAINNGADEIEEFSTDRVGVYAQGEEDIESPTIEVEEEKSEDNPDNVEVIAEEEIQIFSDDKEIEAYSYSYGNILERLINATKTYKDKVLEVKHADTLDDFAVYYNMDCKDEIKVASANSLYMPNAHVYMSNVNVNWNESQEVRIPLNSVVDVDLGCSFALPEGYGVEIVPVDNLADKFGLAMLKPRVVLSKFEAALPMTVQLVGISQVSYIAKYQPLIKCKIIRV